jgi:hypothetical protein
MRLSIALLCCWLLFIAAPSCRAEFILDDFDDPAEVISPQMKGIFVDTEHVGSLNATRSLRIAAFQGDPEGRLDSDISSSSTLTGQITRLNPFPSGETLTAVQSNYQFSPVDFTQNGKNNAFFFDFLQLNSELPPSLFLILLSDGHDNFVHFESAFLLHDQPFTVVIPFDEFPPRGDGNTRPNYTSIKSINVELRASEIAGGGPDPLNFFMQLDRIRVGRVVPEPSSFSLFVAGLVALISVRLRSPD